MPDAPFGNSAPQFGTAEYVGVPAPIACKFCGQAVAGSYYRVNGEAACASCAEQARREVPGESHAAFVRALLFGIGAAVVGMILYAVFEIATGLIIGYVALAVGYLVGKAMMKGSNGRGGRRYQITAAVLTYAAVSLAAIPVGIHYANEHKRAQRVAQQQQLAEEQRELEKESGQQPQELPPAQAPAKPAMSFRMNIGKMGAALLQLAVIGLASPFLELADPIHGVIGLVILFVGIRIAWKLTAGKALEVFGPFDNPVSPTTQG